jgi:hypothetical protein
VVFETLADRMYAKKLSVFLLLAIETILNHNNTSKKNKKNIEFFGFLRYCLIVCMQKKLSFFGGLWLLKPKKNKGKPKKQSFESKPNILLKVLVF